MLPLILLGSHAGYGVPICRGGYLIDMTRSLLVVGVVVICVGCGPTSVTAGAVQHRGCPRNDRDFAPSPDPATHDVLVPDHPIAVLVCRYWGEGDSGPQGVLAAQRYVTVNMKLQAFVRKLNTLRPIPQAASCPVFGGRSVLLLFRYRDAADDPVRIVRSGCIPVSNGHLLDRDGEGLGLGDHWPDEGVL